MESSIDGTDDFPTTAWTCLEKVQNPRDPRHNEALNRFAMLYWRPVFYYLRVKGLAFAKAEDLTQEFFLYLTDQRVVNKADPARGRFRDYLRGVLKRFLASRTGSRARAQDRFEQSVFPLQAVMSSAERDFEPAQGDDPEKIWDRQWAVGLWRQVVQQLRQLYAVEGHAQWWELFVAYHASAGKRPSQEEVAKRFEFSRDEVRTILKKVQMRAERLLKAELREEGIAEREIADEVSGLLRSVGE